MLKVRELRKDKGWTMKQLGEVIGASEASLSMYERGIVEPDLSTICKLADVFNVSIDELLGRLSSI